MKVWAIIPARGGSKGLLGKNIKPLAGEPLLAYSIWAAQACGLVQKTIVSTDDTNIKEIGIEYGADVPFLRPDHLSHDNAKIGDALYYSIDKSVSIFEESPDIMLVLYPTSPLRDPGTLAEFIESSKGYFSTSTVRPITYSDKWNVMVENGPALNMNNIPKNLYMGLGYAYCAIYVPPDIRNSNDNERINAYLIEKTSKFGIDYFRFMNKFFVLEDPVSWIDIDTEFDLICAEEAIFRGIWKWRKDFSMWSSSTLAATEKVS